MIRQSWSLRLFLQKLLSAGYFCLHIPRGSVVCVHRHSKHCLYPSSLSRGLELVLCFGSGTIKEQEHLCPLLFFISKTLRQHWKSPCTPWRKLAPWLLWCFFYQVNSADIQVGNSACCLFEYIQHLSESIDHSFPTKLVEFLQCFLFGLIRYVCRWEYFISWTSEWSCSGQGEIHHHPQTPGEAIPVCQLEL